MKQLTLENVAQLAPRIVAEGCLSLEYATHGCCLECGERTLLMDTLLDLEDLCDCENCGQQCAEAVAILEIGRVKAEELGLGDWVEGHGMPSRPYQIAVECR